jgi:hypothetical protein
MGAKIDIVKLGRNVFERLKAIQARRCKHVGSLWGTRIIGGRPVKVMECPKCRSWQPLIERSPTEALKADSFKPQPIWRR